MAALQLYSTHATAFSCNLIDFEEMCRPPAPLTFWQRLNRVPEPKAIDPTHRAYLEMQLEKDYNKVRWYRMQVRKYSTPELLRKYDLHTRRTFSRVLNTYKKAVLPRRRDKLFL